MQTLPQIYGSDTLEILGKLLNHDDSVNDRNPGSKLCNSEEITRELWRKTFKEDFICLGGMYRGLPPNGKLSSITRDEQQDLYMYDYDWLINFDEIIRWVPPVELYRKLTSKNARMSLIIHFVQPTGRKSEMARILGENKDRGYDFHLRNESALTLPPGINGQVSFSILKFHAKYKTKIMKTINKHLLQFPDNKIMADSKSYLKLNESSKFNITLNSHSSNNNSSKEVSSLFYFTF